MTTVGPEATPGAAMAAEIAEQPNVLEALLDDGLAPITEIAERVRGFDPRFVLFAARGTSDHAALYGKYLVEVGWARAAGLSSPSALTVYGARPDLTGMLFIAVSQSGGSPDLIDSMSVARDCGALTVAITNNPTSALAAAAELHVDVRAGTERAVAATKSYTAELLTLFLLLGGPDASKRAAAIPEAAERTLAFSDPLEAAGRFRGVKRLITTGRGYSYPTAREAALKLMETSYLSAHAFSGADLLHGPLAMIDAEVPVIAVTTPGRGGSAMEPVLDRLSGVGADVLRVGSAAGESGSDGPPPGLRVDMNGVGEELAPILEILPLQRLAWRVALDRGSDPDRPRGLAKVTETW